MKIDTDLRAAIRSAYTQLRKDDSTRKLNKQIEQESIKELLGRKPAIAALFLSAERKIEVLQRKIQDLRFAMDATGLKRRSYWDDNVKPNTGFIIEDAKKFAKSGGRYAPKHVESWNYDTIMAQLAAASEKEGAAILKRIGINWS